MSTTIDQRVVEMKFDNQHFERNVSTTMSTLDKLKQKLHFPGATKGLENVGAAAKRVDLAPISSATETVGLKFNAMYTMADQALRNITNSAMAAGKNIVNALTIDPVKTGLNEYETQINAIQTILSNTESKGTTIDDVTSALDELNEYADKTIYNFTEMTRNIGTFTAAGVDLDTSVTAIQGIANLAAISGSTSQQASTAMYQLSQALASGTVKLMDWNSVVNAGMGGQVFQDALKETARLHGVAIDEMIEGQGSFRETLSDGWLTAEILTDTLQKFTLTTEGLTEEQIQANREMLKAKGYTDEQIESIFKLGKNATDAATKVKTFTQLWDTLKETAQSGWTQTWELIFGDFYEARDLFSGLYETISGFLDGISEARNKLLEGALGSKWSQFAKEIENTGVKMEDFQKTLGEVAKEHGINLDELIAEYGSLEKAVRSGKISTDMIVEAMKRVVGVSDQSVEALAKEDEYLVKKGDCLWRIAKQYGTTWQEIYKLNKDIIDDPDLIYPEQLLKLPEAQLKSLGYTQEQINAMKALAAAAEETNTPIHELITDLQKPSGRELLIESVKNAVNGLLGSLKAIGTAWSDIFGKMESSSLYNIIEAIHKFSTYLVLTEEVTDENGETITRFNERGEKLVRTLKGLFAILDIVTTIIGGGFKIALKVVTSLLSYFGLDLLDVTANVGDALVAFRDWFDGLFDISWILEAIVPWIQSAAEATGEWFAKLKDSKLVKNFTGYLNEATSGIQGWIAGLKETDDPAKYIFDSLISGLKTAASVIGKVSGQIGGYVWKFISGFLDMIGFDASGFLETIKGMASGIKDWIAGIKDADNIGLYILQGIINGLKSGIGFVVSTVWNLGTSILTKIKEVLGIHSPSTAFFDIAWNCILGFVKGIAAAVKMVWDTLGKFGSNLLTFIQNLDIGSALSIAFNTGALIAVYKLATALSSIGSAFEGLGDLFEGCGKVLKSFSGTLKAFSLSLKAKALKDLAIGLLLIAGAVIALTYFYEPKMWAAVGIIAALALILVGLAFAVGKLNTASASIDKTGFNLKGFNTGLLGIAASIAILALAVKLIGSMDPDEAKQGFLGLAGVVLALGAVIAIYGLLVKGKAAQNIDKMGKMLSKMAISLLLLVAVVKLVSKLEWGEMGKGAVFVVGFTVFVLALTAISLLAGKHLDKMGGMLLKMSIAMILMIGVVKLASKLKPEELSKAGEFFAGFLLIVFGLAMISAIAGKEASKIGGTMLALSASMLIMVVVIKMLAAIDPTAMSNGLNGVIILSIIMLVLIAAVNIMGPNAQKLAGTLIAMSVAIGILAVIAVALSFVKAENLWAGIAAVAALGVIVSVMLVAAGKAANATGPLMALVVAIALLVGVIITLSCLDPTKVAVAAVSLSAILGVFSLLLLASGKATGSVGTLVAMSVAIGIMGTILIILSQMPWQNALGAAAALSILMVVLTGVLIALGATEAIVKKALPGAIMLTVASLALISMVYALSQLTGVNNAILSATALSILIAVLTGVLVVLGLASSLVSKALPGVIGLLALTGVLFLLTLVLNTITGVETLIPKVQALSAMLIAMSVALLILTPVGSFIGAAVVGVLGLIGFITVMGAFIAAVGLLVQEFPQIEAFIDTGIPLLEKLAHGIGSIIGSFITGFAEEVLSILPMIAASFSAFMVNMTPFITIVKMVDESVLAGAGFLAGAIIALTVAELINGVASFIGGGLPMLGLELSAFIMNAMPFIMAASLLNEDMMNGVKALAETILILTAADLINGLTSWFTGGSSLEDFGTQLGFLGDGLKNFAAKLEGFSPEQLMIVMLAAQALKTLAQVSQEIPNSGGLLGQIVGENDLGNFAAQFPVLGTGLRNFLTSIGEFTEAEINTVNCAAEAIKILAAASKEIPNSGGLLGQIVGDNDLGTFADQFPDLGTGLRNFLTNIGEFTEAEINTVNCAAEAVKTLASASKQIPNSGGLLADIVGDNELSKFAEAFPDLGSGLRGFLDNVGTFSGAQCATITAAASAVKALAEVAKHIPNEGGWLAKIVGDNDLSTFASHFPKVGEGLKGFADNLGTFSSGQVSTVNAGVKALQTIADLAGVDLKALADNISGFNDNVVGLGDKLAAFVSKLAAVTTLDINTAIHHVKKLVEMFNSVAAVDANAANGFVKSIRDIGEMSVDAFIITFKNNTTVTALKECAKGMLTTFSSAIKNVSSKAKVGSATTEVVEYAVDKMKSTSLYNKAKSAGENLVKGFAAGITAKTFEAKAKAKAMAEAALEAAKEKLKIFSPSRAFYELGDYSGQGFVNALDDYASVAYKSGSEMAGSARDGLRNAIRKIQNVISDDIDAQPTIRPVLDLSDVQSGARTIGSLFSSDASVGLRSNIGAISSMMRDRSQNGVNGNIVDAIDKLRKDVGNLSNTTYSINGVTYDDGSNISDAVSTIIRAAKIERRV